MKNSLKFLCISLSLCLSFIVNSCAKDVIDALTPLKPGEMQATVSGSNAAQFFATNTQVTDNNVTYFIVASVRKFDNSDDSLVIHILIPKRTAPYTIDVGTDPTATVDYCVNTPSSCITYRATLNSGSVTVKVSDTSPTLQGTFSGTLRDLTGGSGSVTMTDGGFNANF
jgi:hypothetical protein